MESIKIGGDKMKEIIKNIKNQSKIFAKNIIDSYIPNKYKNYIQFRKIINDPFYFNIIRNHFIELNIFNAEFENKYKQLTSRDIYEDIYSFTVEYIWRLVKIV